MENEKKTASPNPDQLNPDSSVPESPAQESAKPKRSRRPPAGNRKAKPSAEPSESAGAENAKIKLPAWILPEETKSRKPRKKKAAPAEPEIAEEQPSEAAKPGRSRRPAAEKPKAEPSAEPAEPAKIPVAKFKLPAWILPEESPMEEPDPEITEPEAAKPEASKPETTKPETTKLEISEEQAPEPPKPKRRRRPAGGRKKKASMPTEPVDDTAAPEPVPKPDTWSADTFQVLPEEGKVRFHDMNLPEPLMHGIFDLHFTFCTPIQAEIMPSTLAGRDAFGKAQTGTGKTAAFLITVITRMLNNPIPGQRKPGTPRVLILAPTRELVIQISEEARQLAKYCGLSVIAVFGGMDYDKQRRQLTGKPVDIMVATPGRLLDFQQRRDLYLNKVETLIIDEADRMLDMGFIPDVRKIIYSTPAKDSRQTLLFSATLTETITRLAESWTRDPVTVEIEPEKIAVDTVDQVVYIVTAKEKFALLYNVIEQQKLERVLIFCNRKDQVVKLSEMLTRFGITCSMLSGDVPQQKRVQRLEAFKAGKIRVIVATDVVARGIHIEGMDHVINFKLPHDPEDYVHRIGRTGRAGAAGTSISFADDDDAFYLPDIEAFLGKKLPCIRPDDAWLVMPKPLYPYKPDSDRPPRKPGGSRSGGGKPGNPSPGRRRPGRS